MSKTQKTLLRTRPRTADTKASAAGRPLASPVAAERITADRPRASVNASETERQAPATTTTVCPSCGAKLLVEPDRIKKKLQCPKCFGLIMPSGSSAAPPPQPSPPEPQRAAPDTDTRIADLQARAANLAGQLDQAKAALQEAAGMIGRIVDVEAGLAALAANYVQAVLRIAELQRENAILRGTMTSPLPPREAPVKEVALGGPKSLA